MKDLISYIAKALVDNPEEVAPELLDAIHSELVRSKEDR